MTISWTSTTPSSAHPCQRLTNSKSSQTSLLINFERISVSLQYTSFTLGAPISSGGLFRSMTIQTTSPRNAIFAPYVLVGGPSVKTSFSVDCTGSKAASFDLKSTVDGRYMATQYGALVLVVNSTNRYIALKKTGKSITHDSVYGMRNALSITLGAVLVKGIRPWQARSAEWRRQSWRS